MGTGVVLRRYAALMQFGLVHGCFKLKKLIRKRWAGKTGSLCHKKMCLTARRKKTLRFGVPRGRNASHGETYFVGA